MRTLNEHPAKSGFVCPEHKPWLHLHLVLWAYVEIKSATGAYKKWLKGMMPYHKHQYQNYYLGI